TGREAVDQLLRHNPDVVILDIEMPDLDGIEALPLLLEKKRDLTVIMASMLTRRNAEISLRALSLGAADYIPKPATNREVTTSASFRRDLIEKIRQLGARKKRSIEARARMPAGAPVGLVRPKLGLAEARSSVPGYSPDFKLRPADQFLSPCGRPDVFHRRAGLGGRPSRLDPHRHGLGRHARRAGRGRGRRQRHCTGRSLERRVGHARRRGECRRVLGGAAARCDRTENRAAVPGRTPVTPLDYEYLRNLLRQRSGLVLSADKQYLVESRLTPLARKAGIASLGELVAKVRSNNEKLIVDVV